MISLVNILKQPDKSNPLRINPLPAPGAPAKIMAFGVLTASFKMLTKLIIGFYL